MTRSPERKDILVVDDESDIGGLLVALFESEGRSTDLATNLPAAQLAIRGTEYGVILLDLSLGKRDGRELIKDLEKEAKRTPVIIVSAYTGWLTREDRQNPLIKGTFEKPFDLDAISFTVDKILRGPPFPGMSPRRSLA